MSTYKYKTKILITNLFIMMLMQYQTHSLPSNQKKKKKKKHSLPYVI